MASGYSSNTIMALKQINTGGGTGGTVSDATTTAKGVVQLTNHLGGTATAPTVPGLSGKVDTSDSRLTNARTPTAHSHPQSDITGLGTALTGKVDTSDSRLTDARTPTAHNHPHTDITGLVKADVGLGNVDNTSDANKPVSTAVQTALNSKNSIYTTTGAPSNATGIDGDYAIDSSAKALYGPKASGAWTGPISLVGSNEDVYVEQASSFAIVTGGAAQDVTNVTASFTMPAGPYLLRYWCPWVAGATAGKFISLSLYRTDAGGAGDLLAVAYVNPATANIANEGFVEAVLRNTGSINTKCNIAAGTTVGVKLTAQIQSGGTTGTLNSIPASGLVARLEGIRR